MRFHLPLLLALVAALPAQTASHNRLDFSNWWLANREDHFPNYAAGHVKGDGLFKVFPAEVLDRAGTLRISGYELAFSIDDAYTKTFPVDIETPAVELYRTMVQTIGGKAYETIDLSKPLGVSFPPVKLTVVTDGSWLVKVELAAKDIVSVPALPSGKRAGIAALCLAKEGAKRDPSTPGIVMQASFDERHIGPGRASYSGSYDAKTRTVAMYGQLGQPSASGELYVGLRFDQPVLQMFGESAGGVLRDPQKFETHMGPGAYATDLASRRNTAFFGFFVQAERYDPGKSAPTHRAFPLIVATSMAGPTSALRLGSVELRVNSAELALVGALVDAGLSGPIATYKAGGVAGFDVDQSGVWASPRVPLAPNIGYFGAALWIQALVTDNQLAAVAATNAVRLTLR